MKLKQSIKPRQSVELSAWTVEAFKIGGSVVIALALGYAKFSSVEGRVAEQQLQIASTSAKVEALKETANLLQQKVVMLELQHNLVSGEFRDSLKRIEDDVKELKQDLKTGKAVKP